MPDSTACERLEAATKINRGDSTPIELFWKVLGYGRRESSRCWPRADTPVALILPV